ncbi:hypothetical protein MUK42_29846 [Musa troglodytarum]|uniref:C2H2-type domain-containing protein n=1 Tax=Musa troglodytarum TaxID=320322 RepID=A0A9E7FLR8_9LILI|nr:hypothetical protein MUK42_29846 [Musa troglodytarum]URD99097.1 hypothetical protein MUK42_29846 [Musa troglodytarum]URD99098.1 hypothetical protein MUK42_29846 [Musa troglodytarum]URD99100.1 hypothetical protein MUK42_29846 [Musa troglodytarum]
MVGRELILRKEAAMNLREVAARTTLRDIRQSGHMYVELRHVGKRIIFFCTLCLTQCYSDTVLFDHLGGNLHAQRLEAAKATLFGPTPWPFNDGVLFFDSSRETDMLLSGSDYQNDATLVVSNSSGNDDEATSSFIANPTGMHDGRNCSAQKGSGDGSKLDGPPDAQLGLIVEGCSAPSRSSCSVADMVTTCNWADNSLIIPGVLLKGEVSGLAVQHLGVGQIAYRVQENKKSRGRIITRIWCAWLGQEGSDLSDELNVPVNSQFAIVNFPYAYGLGRKGTPGDEDVPMSPGSFFEVDDTGHRRKRKRKSSSDQEDYSEGLNDSCESPSGVCPSLDSIVAHDPQQLETRLASSMVIGQEPRKQKRLGAERICDICGQPMLPGKDVATLLNCRTGNLACSSRNTNGAFHPFHASCLIHWILICELEMLADQKQSTKTTRGRKERSTLKSLISSAFCPECQGTGISIQGEELEKPTIPLSEMFLYKLKAIEANKAWMKNPEILEKCSTGLRFPPACTENSEETVVPLKLLHFFRAP